MGVKIVYVLLGIFLAGVLNAMYSVFIMFFTVFLFGWKGEPFDTIQSWVIAILAIATSFALIYKIWPRNSPKHTPEIPPESTAN